MSRHSTGRHRTAPPAAPRRSTARHAAPPAPARLRSGTRRGIAMAAAVGLFGLGSTGAGVLAALTATASNGSPLTNTSGTLLLTLADAGDGFSQNITAMAHGKAALAEM